MMASTTTMMNLVPEEDVVKVYENTYRMEPELNEKFIPSVVSAFMTEFLEDRLKIEKYNPKKANELAKEVCNEITTKATTTLNLPRYRLVFQVHIGENKGQGVKFSSRCLWDPSLDGSATASFKNASLFAVAMVFALYYE
eukprot:GCRY01001255.1.p1 GENE.GCRY01001255.1~~GCRY01001255.1.p1  ORF type:complete len:140 (+),score=17.13 GCRY01001255.1:216-635(+)